MIPQRLHLSRLATFGTGRLSGSLMLLASTYSCLLQFMQPISGPFRPCKAIDEMPACQQICFILERLQSNRVGQQEGG